MLVSFCPICIASVRTCTVSFCAGALYVVLYAYQLVLFYEGQLCICRRGSSVAQWLRASDSLPRGSGFNPSQIHTIILYCVISVYLDCTCILVGVSNTDILVNCAVLNIVSIYIIS